LLLNEESRVDAFIKGLRSKQYRSHFLITKPSTMEEVRRTVIHITRKGRWIHTTSNKKHRSDSTSNSCSDSESDSDSSSSNSDSSMEEDFIGMKSSKFRPLPMGHPYQWATLNFKHNITMHEMLSYPTLLQVTSFWSLCIISCFQYDL